MPALSLGWVPPSTRKVPPGTPESNMYTSSSPTVPFNPSQYSESMATRVRPSLAMTGSGSRMAIKSAAAKAAKIRATSRTRAFFQR